MSTAANSGGRNLPAVMQPDQIDYGDASRPVVRYTINDVEIMAKKVGQAGIFGMNEAQAFALMMLCDADGLHPMLAVRRYHILKFGTPAMRAETMLAEMQARGWVVTWTRDNNDPEVQEAVFQHARKCPEGKTVAFTTKDAEKAELLTGPNAANWRKYRPNMLRSRVISNGCRMLDPGIVAGVYSPDEAAEIDAERSGRPDAPAVPGIRPELHQALDAARRPRAKAIDPPSEPAPSTRTPFGEWLDARIADANEQWSAKARKAGIDPGEPINRWQVINAVVSGWIADGTLAAEEVSKDGTPGGKRDKQKATQVFLAAVKQGPDDVQDEVAVYLADKLAELAEEAGVGRRDDTPDEAAAMADDDPPEGGRE